MAVGGVDGHVQAGMAHYLHGAGEPATVAQLGPHDNRAQRADPVVGSGQGFAGRLVPSEVLDLCSQWQAHGVGGIDDVIADRDALAASCGQGDRAAGQPVPVVRRESTWASGRLTPCWKSSAWMRWIHIRR